MKSSSWNVMAIAWYDHPSTRGEQKVRRYGKKIANREIRRSAASDINAQLHDILIDPELDFQEDMALELEREDIAEHLRVEKDLALLEAEYGDDFCIQAYFDDSYYKWKEKMGMVGYSRTLRYDGLMRDSLNPAMGLIDFA